MLTLPFEIISCSWPRPIEQRDNQWASEPEWDAPLNNAPANAHSLVLYSERKRFCTFGSLSNENKT